LKKAPDMNHPLRCRCGTLRGQVSHPEKVSRGVCYCKDCQAFAHFLGTTGDILDERGGTDVVATLAKHVSFTQGVDRLACMSLSKKGMLRWYARCCNTPIGNTLRNMKLSHVGLVHTCLEQLESQTNARTLDAAFGPVRMRVNTQSAKGAAKPKTLPLSTVASIVTFMGSLLRARLDGSYRQTPFFVSGQGRPVVAPKVLTAMERERLMQVVQGTAPAVPTSDVHSPGSRP
jgi:hypothetical protein